MGLFRSEGSEQDGLEKEMEAQKKQHAATRGMDAAMQAATKDQRELIQNPQFLRQVQDPDLDTEEFPELEANLGPITSGAHILGNRSESYEREIKWLNRNRSERQIAHGSPGRLCKGRTREVAHGAHDRERDAPEKIMTDEKMAIRAAYMALTNRMSLSVNNRGLRAVTEATAVQRLEESDEDDGLASKAGSALK